MDALQPNEGVGVRTRVLTAAEQVFAVRGFHGATVAEIAELAGSNKPMIYYHFGSKAGLFVELAKQMLESVRLTIDAESEIANTHLERLAVFVRSYSRALGQPQSFAARVVAELPGLPINLRAEVMVAYDREIVSALRELIGAGTRAGAFRAVDVDGSASAITAIVHNFARQGTSQEAVIASSCEQTIEIYGRGLLSDNA